MGSWVSPFYRIRLVPKSNTKLEGVVYSWRPIEGGRVKVQLLRGIVHTSNIEPYKILDTSIDLYLWNSWKWVTLTMIEVIPINIYFRGWRCRATWYDERRGKQLCTCIGPWWLWLGHSACEITNLIRGRIWVHLLEVNWEHCWNWICNHCYGICGSVYWPECYIFHIGTIHWHWLCRVSILIDSASIIGKWHLVKCSHIEIEISLPYKSLKFIVSWIYSIVVKCKVNCMRTTYPNLSISISIMISSFMICYNGGGCI